MERARATRLGLLLLPRAREGWGGGELKCSVMSCAPSLSLPRKRGGDHVAPPIVPRAMINLLQLPVAARRILSVWSASTLGMSSRLPESAAITMSE